MLSVVMWATGISAGFVGVAYTAVSNKFEAFNQAAFNHESRISSIEADIKRLPVIESKLDSLLINQGINPQKINYEAKN